MANNLAPPMGPPPGQMGGPKPSKGSGFFHSKPKEPVPRGPSPDMFRDITRRLRIVEEQYANLRKNVRVGEQNVIAIGKEVNRETAVLTSEIQELKHAISQIKDELKLIISELKGTAKKEDVEVLDKYINMWEPVKFCTQKDVENIVRRMLREQR